MSLTKNQIELVRKMARIHAGLYMLVATNSDIITIEEVKEIVQNSAFKIVSKLPRKGETHVVYFVPGNGKTTPKNVYDAYVWVQQENEKFIFEKIGQVSYEMRNHYKNEELAEILEDYIDYDNPVSRNASDYENDLDYAKIFYAKDGISLSNWVMYITDGMTVEELVIHEDKDVPDGLVLYDDMSIVSGSGGHVPEGSPFTIYDSKHLFNLYNPLEAAPIDLQNNFNVKEDLVNTHGLDNCLAKLQSTLDAGLLDAMAPNYPIEVVSLPVHGKPLTF